MFRRRVRAFGRCYGNKIPEEAQIIAVFMLRTFDTRLSVLYSFAAIVCTMRSGDFSPCGIIPPGASISTWTTERPTKLSIDVFNVSLHSWCKETRDAGSGIEIRFVCANMVIGTSDLPYL